MEPSAQSFQWIVVIQKRQQGPYSEAQVRDLLREGPLKHTDIGMKIIAGRPSENSGWKLLWQFPEFDRRKVQRPPAAMVGASAKVGLPPPKRDAHSAQSLAMTGPPKPPAEEKPFVEKRVGMSNEAIKAAIEAQLAGDLLEMAVVDAIHQHKERPLGVAVRPINQPDTAEVSPSGLAENMPRAAALFAVALLLLLVIQWAPWKESPATPDPVAARAPVPETQKPPPVAQIVAPQRAALAPAAPVARPRSSFSLGQDSPAPRPLANRPAVTMPRRMSPRIRQVEKARDKTRPNIRRRIANIDEESNPEDQPGLDERSPQDERLAQEELDTPQEDEAR